MNSLRALRLGLLLAACTQPENAADNPAPAPAQNVAAPATATGTHDPVVALRSTLMAAPLSAPRLFIAEELPGGDSPAGDILRLRAGVKAQADDADAHLALAEALRRDRDYAAAEERYREAIRLAGNNPVAHAGLVRLLISVGRNDDAVRALQAATKAAAPTAELHFLDGSLAARQGEYDRAVASLNATLDMDPEYERGHFELAGALERQGSTSAAIAALRRGLDQLPQSIGLRLKLAELLAAAAEYDTALEELRRLIEMDPSLTAAHVIMARIHRQRGDVAAARVAIDAGLEVESSSVDLSAELGLLLLDDGLGAEAIPYLERAIYNDPDLLEACSALGRLYEAAGDGDRAQILLDYVEHLRDHEVEVRAFKTAIALDKNDASAFFAAGSMYTHMMRPLAASQALEVGLQFVPDNLEALNNLGLVLLSMRQLPRAIEACERAIAFDSTFVAAYANLGRALAVSGEMERAIATFEHALMIEPDFAPAYMGLGRVYERLGRTEEAKAALAKFERLAAASSPE